MTSVGKVRTRPAISMWSVALQDRQRLLWSRMSPLEQRISHKQAEWQCAKEEKDRAMLAGNLSHEAAMDAAMDRLNADIDALHEMVQS